MKTKHIFLSPEVRDVLERCEITPAGIFRVVLPPGLLERSLYSAVNKVLENAGGKWDRKSKSHLFISDPREALGLAVATGKAVDRKQTFQAFYTPRALADTLADYLHISDGESVLEPSAGEGALVLAAQRRGGIVTAIEADPETAVKCSTAMGGVGVAALDFLRGDPSMFARPHDVVIMNPPFTGDQDIAHVTHALDFLRIGGRLGAIMSPRFRIINNAACERFRALVKANDARVVDVPAGVFRESGTDIATVIVLFNCRRIPAEKQAALLGNRTGKGRTTEAFIDAGGLDG